MNVCLHADAAGVGSGASQAEFLDNCEVLSHFLLIEGKSVAAMFSPVEPARNQIKANQNGLISTHLTDR